ncbi:MAG: hypothetical protein JSV51_06335 [Candidatus Bathyarchaeota archaeon]|nr:MAG: hypothetical protein JSV51_06335 [Candidatus Bathyarchaeota archaeon]
MNPQMWLFGMLKSGNASILANGIETLHLSVEKKRIDFNLMNRQLLIDLLKNADVKDQSLLKNLAMLKSLAQELKKENLTLTISYKGSLLLTLGSEAKSTISQTFTGTDAIAINDMKRLIQIFLG